MGKQKGMYRHGKEGNILYYSWKGIQCERTIPKIVYQSPVVVAHKTANALATILGGALRKLLTNVIPYPKNMQMQTAVRVALLRWIKQGPVSSDPPHHIPFITGLSFNDRALLKDCLSVIPLLTATAPGELTVWLPEIVPSAAFSAPPGTTHIQLKITAACCNFQTGDAIKSNDQQVLIPFNDESMPDQTFTFTPQMPVSSFTIVVVALDYFSGDHLIADERFLPCQVIGGVVKTG